MPTEVTIDNCGNTDCRLVKKSTVHLSFNFIPSNFILHLFTPKLYILKKLLFTARPLQSLQTNVSAFMMNMNLPFLGVTGTSANGNVFDKDGSSPATFPLHPNQSYVYKRSFPILPFYPLSHMTITWAISPNGGGDDVVCFEVGANIVAK